MPVEDIEPGILEFVDRYVDRFVTWDVLVFFQENPDAERKPSEIASRIGRKAALVNASLATLHDKGIVTREPDEAGEPSYRYVPPPEFKSGMEGFISATRERTARLAIVSRVLQKEARNL